MLSNRRSAALFLLVAAACGGRRDAPPDAVYSVRGKVVELSGSGRDRRATIAHEAIPEFADRDGKVARMDAMRMAFGLAETVDASALVPGSQWQLTFVVRWAEEPALLITAAKPLAPDTRLTL